VYFVGGKEKYAPGKSSQINADIIQKKCAFACVHRRLKRDAQISAIYATIIRICGDKF
jgi:hypothetical protein